MAVQNNIEPSKNDSMKLIQLHMPLCNRALHSLSFKHCQAILNIIPLLPKATVMPCIQLNLSTSYPPSIYFCHKQPSGHSELIHSFHMPKPSQFLWSALLGNSLSIPGFWCTSSFQDRSLLGRCFRVIPCSFWCTVLQCGAWLLTHTLRGSS